MSDLAAPIISKGGLHERTNAMGTKFIRPAPRPAERCAAGSGSNRCVRWRIHCLRYQKGRQAMTFILAGIVFAALLVVTIGNEEVQRWKQKERERDNDKPDN